MNCLTMTHLKIGTKIKTKGGEKMKAKYRHDGSDCLIYDQVICEDNVVVTVRSYYGSWCDIEPQSTTKVCITNAEARRMFFNICKKFEEKRYDCEYREDY